MSPSAAVYLALVGAICDVVAVAVVVGWFFSRKRIAGEIVGRAEQHAVQTRQHAEREAESLKKEAQLEAREKAHTLVAEAEAAARTHQQEMARLERATIDKTRAIADRLAATESLERDLHARDAAAGEIQKRLEAAANPSEQIVVDRH